MAKRKKEKKIFETKSEVVPWVKEERFVELLRAMSEKKDDKERGQKSQQTLTP